MSTTDELVARLRHGEARFLAWAYDRPYAGPPVISIPRHKDNVDALLAEAADAIETLTRERDEAREACAMNNDTHSRISADYTQTIRALEALLASLDEERLEEIITDSIDLDWTPRTAARAIVRAMKGGQS